MPVKLAADRPDLRGLAVLSWLASQGECAANQVQEVFNQWATLLDDADWMLVMGKSMLRALGVEIREEELRELPINLTSKEKRKSSEGELKKKKAASPPSSVSPPIETEKKALSPSTEVPLEAIPRFSPRK